MYRPRTLSTTTTDAFHIYMHRLLAISPLESMPVVGTAKISARKKRALLVQSNELVGLYAPRVVVLQLYGAADPTPTQLAEEADKHCLVVSLVTSNMFSTASSLSPPAISIVCAHDGTTFHYQ